VSRRPPTTSLGREISCATPPQAKIDRTWGVRRFKISCKSAAVALERSRGDYQPRDPNSVDRTSLRCKCLKHVARVSESGGGMVRVRGYADGRVSVGGVYRCHSIAECPWCAEEEASERADVVRSVVRNFERHGGGVVYFATLTCRHSHGDNLRELRKALCASWRDIWTGKGAGKMRRRLELDGFIRALDVTHGANGWHPHLHVLIFCRAELSGRALRRFEAWVYHRWCRRWAKHGLSADPTRERAVRIERAGDPEGRYQSTKAGRKVSGDAAAEYIIKMGLGRELTSAMDKEGRKGSRTAWRILADYSKRGRQADAGLWNDWCRAMRGARWLTWSKGLRERWQTEKPEASRPAPSLEVYLPPVTWTTRTYHQISVDLDKLSTEAMFRAECERDRLSTGSDRSTELLA
jgi:hypothetical protein